MSETVRQALYEMLKADSTLKGLAPGGVWFESVDGTAPEGPTVVYSQASGKADWCFDGDPMRSQQWDIKGIGPTKTAEQIDTRCRELLTNADLNITGIETKYLRPGMDVNYREQTDGEVYQHVGATYSIITERME